MILTHLQLSLPTRCPGASTSFSMHTVEARPRTPVPHPQRRLPARRTSSHLMGSLEVRGVPRLSQPLSPKSSRDAESPVIVSIPPPDWRLPAPHVAQPTWPKQPGWTVELMLTSCAVPPPKRTISHPRKDHQRPSSSGMDNPQSPETMSPLDNYRPSYVKITTYKKI